MVFIDEADVVVDPTLIEVDVGAYAVAAGPAGGVVDAVPRARLGHLVAPLVGTHLGDKPSRAAPFIDLIAGWSSADAPGGEAVGNFVDGRLEALPLHPIVSNPVATDILSFRTQWHAATTERKVAYSERERVTAWLLNPFVQRPAPPGRVVTALADAAVFSEAADREMRVLGGETVSVVGFWRRAREGEEDTGFVLDEYVERLRALKPGDRVTVVRNGLEHPVGGTAGVVVAPEASSADDGNKLRIQEEEGGGVALELTPDRYPGFFVFPEDAPRTFSKAGIVRAVVSARLTGALEFVLPTTSSEAARVALGDRGPRHGFSSRAEMYEAVSRAAAEAGFAPPAFDTVLWAAFPALERGHGREATEDDAVAAVVAPGEDADVDHAAAAAEALKAASRARFTPMDARERVAALATHAAEVERGAPEGGPRERVSLLSLKYGPPPEGAVVDLGFLGVVDEGRGGLWDPVTGAVGATLEKLRAARHAELSAEVAEVFAPPEEGLADRHVREHFAEIGGFGRDEPPAVGHSEEVVVVVTKTKPVLVDEGFGDAVAAPGDDETSHLDAAIAAFLAKVGGGGDRRVPRRIQGAHLIRTVVSYFAERQLRTRFQSAEEDGGPASAAKLPGWFWLSPGLYAAMARAQDDADILRDLGVVLEVYVPAACKALISVGAVTQRGVAPRELERRVDAVISEGLARSVERVKDAMLSMERVLRGIGTRDTAAVRQVGDFPDERYAPPHRGEPLEEGFELLRPAAGGLNMVVTAEDEGAERAAAPVVMAPAAEVFGVPPPPPQEPVRVFDSPVVVPVALLLPEEEAGDDGRQETTPWAEELMRANPWLFDSPAPVRSAELLTWLDARVSELLPRSGLRRGLSDRVMRAPQGAARHALSSVVLERLGPLLRTHRPQEPQLLRKELLARADPDTAVALLTFVLVAYMARAGGQGPLVDDLNDVLDARIDAATLNAQVLEDRFERMREDYRQENFGAMRAMDKADRAIFGELLVHRIVTVGDVRDAAAAAAASDEGGEGEEMVPVNREEYGDDQ
jgi:hypothetical protein